MSVQDTIKQQVSGNKVVADATLHRLDEGHGMTRVTTTPTPGGAARGGGCSSSPTGWSWAGGPRPRPVSRRHHDANVLTLAGRRLSDDQAKAIVDSFLATDFEAGRHERRVSEIAELERGEDL